MRTRTPIIAGNWKMNNTITDGVELVKAIHFGLGQCPPDSEIVVAPPFTALSKVADFLKNSFIKVSGQDIFWEESGAFTGEISGQMLKDAGADYVIIGHSERRQYFHETDDTVNKKVKAAIASELIPIVCVGETLAQREAHQVQEVITHQIVEGLKEISPNNVAASVIAYEPVWAIGTGKTASTAQAEEVHIMIRGLIALHFGQNAADKIRIIYGGSVKPSNSKELLAVPDIDGALIGGASLKASEFIEIIRSSI
jgi:triosephosphate isomerase